MNKGGKIVAALAMAAGLTVFSGAARADIRCMGEKGQPESETFRFDKDQSRVPRAEEARLRELAERAKNRITVCVIGQADKQGNAEYNKKLALKRAQAVADYLAKYGVRRSSMVIETRGEAFGDALFALVADTDRRVEVQLVR